MLSPRPSSRSRRDSAVTKSVYFLKRTVANDLGVDNPSALLEASSSDEIKQTLKKNTDEALAMGCFGAPWIHVHTRGGKVEPFFGSDRLPLIGHLIGEQFQGPLTHLASPS
ncbi:hypothetical protein Y032_0059g2988 [Ancylostoma ceylanicum]|uniref:DSBA-like thioredoxin domain-containing protein n=1 Tax=Ancylostoma ceylanicum TaxID=53326 RepID=A0A016U305_9BILA|nr:hypothetical protein Y032_0059g2988 [Ancylostoma ceylanicum]